jgi:hypothetical protein
MKNKGVKMKSRTQVKMNDGRTIYDVKESVDDIRDYIDDASNLETEFILKILINLSNIIAVTEGYC